MRSWPASPAITSRPGPPRSTSSPAVPTSVARSPWHITAAAAEVGTATAYDATAVPSAVRTAVITRAMRGVFMWCPFGCAPASRGT